MSAPRLEGLLHNYWMNSLMEDWQRVVGNTVTINTATSQGFYAADRIKTVSSGPTIKNYSVQRGTSTFPSQVQTNGKFPFTHRFNCLTAIASPNVADLVIPIRHHMEGIFYRDLHGGVIGFGFWVNLVAPAGVFPLTLPIAFKNDATNRSYVSTFSITANGAWQFIYVPIQTDLSGVWLLDNGTGIAVSIGAVSGTNYHAPSLNQWVNGEYYSAAGVFNIMSNNGNILRTTGFRAHPISSISDLIDSTVHPRMGRNAQAEQILDDRYYQKSFARDVVPGTTYAIGVFPTGNWAVITNSIGGAQQSVLFNTPMRSTPVGGIWSHTGLIDRVSSASGAVRTVIAQTDHPMGIRFTWSSPGEDQVGWLWTADADF